MPVDSVLRILVAEDSAADRLLLAQLVRRLGHEVRSVENGERAVAVFARWRPQLVLLDALMPVMDGFEAARRIKHLAGETLVPIIFLTALNEEQALVQCLEAGGDDFLAKPYSAAILAAKIRTMVRLHRLQATLVAQRDQITAHHQRLLNEQRLAKRVFDRVVHAGCLGARHIRYRQSPFALFSGDLLLADTTPAGDLHVLLGDFTGHGLPAAVGAMPLAEAFYGMTARGHGLSQTVRELNSRLKDILPVEMFCCALVLSFSVRHMAVEIWNGGMPEAYRLSASGALLGTVASRHLPLGIVDAAQFDDSSEVLPLLAGERLLLFSDGVLDCVNAEQQRFGVERLRQVLAANHTPATLLDDILLAVERFGGRPADDLSLCDISMPLAGELAVMAPAIDLEAAGLLALEWTLQLELQAHSLRHFNPVPSLVQLLQEIQGLPINSGVLHTVLSELYSNALEHGVLGLDSQLKQGTGGFADYYRQRGARLARQRDGFIRIDLRVEPVRRGGRLTVEVRDSGPGFAVEKLSACGPDPCLSGRGMALVRSLCSVAKWTEGGRCAHVELDW